MPQISVPGIAQNPQYPTRPQTTGGYGIIGEFMQKLGNKAQEFEANQQKTRMMMDQMLQRRMNAQRAARAEERQIAAIEENKRRYDESQKQALVDQKIKDNKYRVWKQEKDDAEKQKNAYGKAYRNFLNLDPKRRTAAQWDAEALAEGYYGTQKPHGIYDTGKSGARAAKIAGAYRTGPGKQIANFYDQTKNKAQASAMVDKHYDEISKKSQSANRLINEYYSLTEKQQDYLMYEPRRNAAMRAQQYLEAAKPIKQELQDLRMVMQSQDAPQQTISTGAQAGPSQSTGMKYTPNFTNPTPVDSIQVNVPGLSAEDQQGIKDAYKEFLDPNSNMSDDERMKWEAAFSQPPFSYITKQ